MPSPTITLDEVSAQFNENADYARAGSLTKAELFKEACLLLWHHKPQRSKLGNEELEFYDAIPGLLAEVNGFLAAKPEYGGGVKHPDLRGLRD